MTDRAPITEHTLKRAVKVDRGWKYYPPHRGPSLWLVTPQELDERKITQDYWMSEQQKRLSDSARNTAEATVTPEPAP